MNKGPQATKAAIYVRMSTDHQRYSIEHQIAAINEYADLHKIEIVETFADEGKSGLTFDKRDALKRLIEVVQTKKVIFDCILVLDITRWGRFQDVDESAFYEYTCRKNGIAVHYTAEPFQNDNSPLSAVLKAIKRTMAGEYSRELSSKVFKARCRLGSKGFRQGGTAGLGLRRAVVDDSGKIKCILKREERKSFPTDRIILVPGPKREIKLVNWIYKKFVSEGWGQAAIASYLNKKGIKSDLDRTWTRCTIKQILTNEKYIGNLVINRRSYKFATSPVNNPPDTWVRANCVYKPIICHKMFKRAQHRIAAMQIRLTDEQVLERLKLLLKNKGELTAAIIDEAKDVLASSRIIQRFGSIRNAYDLIGYTPSKKYSFFPIKHHLENVRIFIEEIILNKFSSLGIPSERLTGCWNLLKINGVTISLVICVCGKRKLRPDKNEWLGVFGKRAKLSQWVIVIRMDEKNEKVMGLYFVPTNKIKTPWIRCPKMRALDLRNFSCADTNELCSTIRDKVLNAALSA